jgi:hypothetical protein
MKKQSRCFNALFTTIILLMLNLRLHATEIELYYMASGPTPSSSIADRIVEVIPQSAVMLNNVPSSNWTYGCSPTAAGMMFGYYDRTGYSNMYSGTVNNGIAPLSNLGNQCSIIATLNGFDGRTTNGHVDDYWGNGSSLSPDPWEGNWSEHRWADCTADFMGSNQLKWDYLGGDGVRDYCKDGVTAFFAYNGSQKLYDYTPSSVYGMPQTSLCHGLRLFTESRGYSVVENYTQKIDSLYTGGFSFADYMSEIDTGAPVMIQLAGHSMTGIGYDMTTETIYFHDTWGDYVGSMPWGGSYSGMTHIAMTVLHLNPIPEPTTALLLFGGVLILRHRNRK